MLSIGEFSKICQVSVKTLHYYDRIGLLRPVRVDAFTGYRYYSQEQMEQMLYIHATASCWKRYGNSWHVQTHTCWLQDCCSRKKD